jgi:hypothetical protein
VVVRTLDTRLLVQMTENTVTREKRKEVLSWKIRSFYFQRTNSCGLQFYVCMHPCTGANWLLEARCRCACVNVPLSAMGYTCRRGPHELQLGSKGAMGCC